MEIFFSFPIVLELVLPTVAVLPTSSFCSPTQQEPLLSRKTAAGNGLNISLAAFEEKG